MHGPAPLIATPAAPIPAGGQAEWFTGAGGARLRAALFPAKGEPRGSVVLSGGRTEPIEKYFEVVGELTGRGFVVLAHDWRGQGLSWRAYPDERLKGHADGFNDFVDDYHALLAAFEHRLPGPWIALSHSMGGALTLMALAQGEAPRFAAAVLSAPMLDVLTGAIPRRLAAPVAALAKRLGRGGSYVPADPGKSFDAPFEGNALTHDPARFARSLAQVTACPDLALGGPTWGWLDFAFRLHAWLFRPGALGRVTLPVVILSAEQEKLVDNTAQRRAAAALPNARLVTVPGALHEILMETDDRRAVFWTEFDAVADAVAPKKA